MCEGEAASITPDAQVAHHLVYALNSEPRFRHPRVHNN